MQQLHNKCRKLKRDREEKVYTKIYSELALSFSQAPTMVFNGLKSFGNNLFFSISKVNVQVF